jgi:hypothetical protein
MDQINKQIDDITTTLNTLNIFKSTLIQKNLSSLAPEESSVRYIDWLTKLEQDFKDQKYKLQHQIISDIKGKISNRLNALIDAASTLNDYNKILKVLRLLKIKSSSDRCVDDDTLEYDDQQINSL